MIYLKKIKSEPEGLFDEVVFRKGINIISGKQEKTADEKPSLNSIGKSTLISLIDFCLLSSFDKKHKLFKAKNFLDDYRIVLTISINEKELTIKRSTKNEKKVILVDEESEREELKIEDAKKILYRKMFAPDKYGGVSDDKWFRTIMPLFIRSEKDGFLDTIKYYSQAKGHTHSKYHLMLMGIDNTLSKKNESLLSELEEKEGDQNRIEKIIREKYGEIESIGDEIHKLEREIQLTEDSINRFQLNKTYEQEEEEINDLTKEIKGIILENHQRKNLLEDYKESYNLEVDIDTRKISSVYGEIDKELGIKLKKTLDETLEFKKKLIESRKNFIKDKIEEISTRIQENSQKIKKLDIKRASILNSLEDRRAIEDLTSSFSLISDKKRDYEDLRSNFSLIEETKKEYLSKKTDYAKLQEEMNKFVGAIKREIFSIREIYSEIYDSLYENREEKGFFDIEFNKRMKSRLNIIAKSPDADGFGKGRACIFVYDLTLLLNIVKNKLPYPCFWIHDGIFTGIYTNQFVSAMNLLNKYSSGMDFQYITTLNDDEEEVTNKDKFGQLDFDLKEKTIATYSNLTEGKIFKRDF